MPKLGLTMTEGTVSSWLKKEGDEVKEGEPLFEVETDKLTNTIEAPASGILRKIIVAAGATVPVLDKVAVIAAADEDISGLLSGGAAPAARCGPGSGSCGSRGGPLRRAHVVASPRAKKLAKDKGIDIALVKGTGPNGRITEDDVNNYKPQPRRLPPSPLSRPPRWQPRWPPTRA
jgi:pyruvate dehydrogenase E2 component (dihydrolipoamide acetyltransferase)